MMFTARKLRIVILTLSCLLLQVAWGSDDGDGDLVVQEYYRLLSMANDGEASDKVSLFLYALQHSGELEKYAATALEHLVEASNDGYGEASFWVGYISENGVWMEQNDQGAMIYYVLSAQQGFDKGMHASLLHFVKAATAAASEEERESALGNAQKWYDALAEIRDDSESVFKAARFNYAVARLRLNPMDEYGMNLLGEAAIDGDKSAASLIRNVYAEVSAGAFDGDNDAARIIELWKPTIEVIGASDEQTD